MSLPVAGGRRLAVLLILIGGGLSGLLLAWPFVYLANPRPAEPVTVPADGYDLAGWFAPGTAVDGAVNGAAGGPWVILVHGNRPDGVAHPLYQAILGHLDRRVAVLALDLSGYGRSDPAGLQRGGRQFDRLADLDAAVRYLEQQHGARPEQIVLVGHSLGAAQVLHAAQARPFQRVIPIGLGNYSVQLDDPAQLLAYSAKLAEHTGVPFPPEPLRAELVDFAPAGLFTPCPATPVTLVYGGRDHDDILQRRAGDVPAACDVDWVTIPLADHMYGTEASPLPALMEPLYGRTAVALLVRQLNRLIIR